MAFTHIYFNPQSTHGPLLKSGLTQLEGGLNGLTALLATMTTMIDGDGSDPAQFTEMTARFGFVDNTSAKAAWDELNSCLAKLNTDADVTFVHAALVQAFNKFR